MASSNLTSTFSLPKPAPWRPWIMSSLVAVLVMGAAVALMHAMGMFEVSPDDSGTKRLAAALALVGSLFASVVTLIGIALKYSIDDRNTALAYVEAERANVLRQEAEKRNRVDTSIRAVDLLGENNADASKHQICGAVLALLNLGEIELALSLLFDLWPDDKLTPSVASQVLFEALQSDEEHIITSAAVAVVRNASKLDLDGAHIWPIGNEGWDPSLPLNARTSLAFAASIWMEVALIKNARKLPTAFLVLHKALEDPDQGVQNIAVGALHPLVDHFDDDMGMFTETGELKIQDVKQSLAALSDEIITDYGEQARDRIKAVLASPTPAQSDS